MKNDGKVLKIKKNKSFLTKKKINERNINNHDITFGDINQYIEYEENTHSKSINKKNNIEGLNTKKSLPIKLPLMKNYIHHSNNENDTNDSKIVKKSKKKLKINTNSSINLLQKNTQNKLFSKNSGSSHNLKISPDHVKTKNIINSSSTNIGVVRHLNRKIIKGNKNKIKPIHGYTKLFTTTKIINNFNNQINQNKNKEIINVYDDKGNTDDNDEKDINETHNNNHNNHDSNKKIDVLFDIEKKVSKIQNLFRKHLKDEQYLGNNNNEIHTNNINYNNVNNVDFISEISLSEEELNFSEDDSFDNMEFSIEDEEI
jgi:hypothetical protein